MVPFILFKVFNYFLQCTALVLLYLSEDIPVRIVSTITETNRTTSDSSLSNYSHHYMLFIRWELEDVCQPYIMKNLLDFIPPCSWVCVCLGVWMWLWVYVCGGNPLDMIPPCCRVCVFVCTVQYQVLFRMSSSCWVCIPKENHLLFLFIILV